MVCAKLSADVELGLCNVFPATDCQLLCTSIYLAQDSLRSLLAKYEAFTGVSPDAQLAEDCQLMGSLHIVQDCQLLDV